MRRSITNPRVVLACVVGIVVIWAIAWAYLTRPRIVAGFGGLADTVMITKSRFGVDVRSTHFRDSFEKRLGSTKFMEPLTTLDSRMPPLFSSNRATVAHFEPSLDLGMTPTPVQPGSKIAPSATATQGVDAMAASVRSALNGDRIAFTTGRSGKSDLYVMYLHLKSYSVSEPPNRWIGWLQTWLPGMPSGKELKEYAAEVDAANQAAKDAVKAQIERAAEKSASAR